MMDFKNQVVEDHLLIGPPSLKPFKLIIKKVLYPEFDSQKLSLVEDAVNGYLIMGGSPENVFELNLYALECAAYYIYDVCDIEEEFYEFTTNQFAIVINLFKSKPEISQQFKQRLKTLVKIASRNECYGDTIQELWQTAFGHI